jgi:hypothetical protein
VKILELNARHPLMHNLSAMLGMDANPGLVDAAVEQVFETALLQDGIHPDPASMADRLTLILQAATGSAADDLAFPEVEHAAPVEADEEVVGDGDGGNEADDSAEDAGDDAEE